MIGKTAGKAFFDTNVLLYIYGGDAAKRERATALFNDMAGGGIAVSTQVIQEFIVTSRKVGMARAALKNVLPTLLDLPMVLIDWPHIRRALEHEERYQISFWDALIVAAAESSGAEVLYTEDLNHGQRYGAVLVQNPFAN
jgi:predicted nucleic acid-binding protein